MKQKHLVALLASLVAGSAFAQSNVTIYGLIDTSLRHSTNVPVTGSTPQSQTAMQMGVLTGPRIGFKGEEDLGGGTSAVFLLENGFSSNNGALGQQGQLFGRQEYIGLKDKTLGEIDAGRQYGAIYDGLVATFDPIPGDNGSIDWQYYVEGYRFDNTLKYTNTWGPVKAEVQYSAGGQAGATNIGSTKGLVLLYTEGPYSAGAAYQLSTDAKSNEASIFGVGGSYVAGPAKLFLSYVDAKRDAGFAAGASSTAASASSAPLANTNLITNAGNTLQRTDDVWTAGVVYNPTAAWSYTLAYKYDSVKNDSSKGDDGHLSSLIAIADYNFSKRTDVYLELDHESVGGGEVSDANPVLSGAGASLGGATGRTGITLGLRTRF